MADILLNASLVLCWIAVILMQQTIRKLKCRIDDNKMLINDLYRIDDERLLHSETDGK